MKAVIGFRGNVDHVPVKEPLIVWQTIDRSTVQQVINTGWS
jgi:hypothetical protein